MAASLCVPLYGSVRSLGCGSQLVPALGALMTAAYCDQAVYRDGHCYGNSGELGRRFAEALGDDFDEAKLKILVIRPAGARTLMNSRASVRDPYLLARFVRAPQEWMYHAVLEYGGWVLDLDHHTPKPLRRRQYFPLRFANRLRSVPIVVHVVPWRDYASMHSVRLPPGRETAFDMDWVFQYPTVDPLGPWAHRSDYLADYEPASVSSGTAMGTAPGTR